MTIDKQLVWVRDPNEGFVLARILELMGEEVDVIPVDNKNPRRVCSFDDVFPAGDPTKVVDDNCELMFLNEATLLNNILTLYKKKKIYTYVANILLAVNPYEDIPDMYSSSTIKKYQGKSLGEMPPHVFAVADKAFRDMKSLKQSQSIIVSGESGAGKTESTKYILKYLCDLWAKGAGPVEQKILDANPILEAFGNAKTTRNNNSSRFGKFMEVHFSNKYQVVGGHISHYLLEKSRICTQSAEERNYHVFYLLCAGAPQDLRAALKITKPDDYNYLKNSCTQYFTTAQSEKKLTQDRKSKQQQARGGLRDPILDDIEDFGRLHQALSHIGLSEAEKKAVYSVVAAVLHLGNVQFEDDGGAKGGCRVSPESEPSLATTAGLLGVDAGELRMALVSRLMQSSRGGMKGTAIIYVIGTGTNFIRCIKPNSRMVGREIEGSLVLTQLECSGTISVLELMEHGYPCRAPFSELHTMYKGYLPSKLQGLSSKWFCEAIIHSFGLSDKDYKFGITRVFFRPGKYSEFDTIMRSDPENLKAIVGAVLTWLVKSRWRRSIFAVVSIIKLKNKILYRRECLVKIQKSIRGYLVRRRHQPRYRGIAKIRALTNNLKEMETTAGQLKKEKASMLKNIENLRNDIVNACSTIKRNDKISRMEIDQLYSDVVKKVETQMSVLQKTMIDQKNREEQERLRRIEAELRAAEEAKRREQERLRQEEENRRLKAEMEARRKAEEAERRRLEEQDRIAALKLQQELEKAVKVDQENRERLEQERRDHEMAVRLAKETNGHVEGSPPQFRSFPSETVNGENKLNRSERVRMQQAMQGKQKYDLSKWKYSELRDTINTSCDIELLEACRHEFHRRLKVYHAWKAKNARKTTMADQERAPQSIMDAAKTPRVTQKSEILGARHRYFRIPFVRPSATGGATDSPDRRGWWYAHFDGQYVARQMELHPDKTPVLLQSGVDDMQMCELSLDETGLTRKRGAEILEHEFEHEWASHGGAPYVSSELRKR
ncbi:myosin heavy chain 95F [Hyposmocoma kahamanoa]|uniref:myosin heavy chain 95F n=1 Tax=Hyposmocoma kahamanoa TaxID=1477025 RepID=UPI000E6D76CB|nr:myosin heavy chain 95F [Hyposmocoma kahamanoa]